LFILFAKEETEKETAKILGAVTKSIMTRSIMTLSIMAFIPTLSISNTQNNERQHLVPFYAG
jgi:hypothetical protein